MFRKAALPILTITAITATLLWWFNRRRSDENDDDDDEIDYENDSNSNAQASAICNVQRSIIMPPKTPQSSTFGDVDTCTPSTCRRANIIISPVTPSSLSSYPYSYLELSTRSSQSSLSLPTPISIFSISGEFSNQPSFSFPSSRPLQLLNEQLKLKVNAVRRSRVLSVIAQGSIHTNPSSVVYSPNISGLNLGRTVSNIDKAPERLLSRTFTFPRLVITCLSSSAHALSMPAGLWNLQADLPCDVSNRSVKPIQVTNWTSVSSYEPKTFERHELLGAGIAGSVYRGRDDNGKWYALKCFRRFVVHGIEVNEGLVMSELLMHSRASCHPNVVDVYGMYVDNVNNEFVMVMNLDEPCRDLHEEIFKRGGHVEEWLAMDFITQITTGLEHVHARNIVHRDIKPENIIVCGDDSEEAKITDFGCTIEVNMADGMARDAGTNGYMAPEFLNGESYGTKVDMFALGVTMYRMLIGSRPFADNAREVFELNFEGSDVSDDAKDLMARLLERDPERRLDASGVLEHRWIAG